MSVSLGASVYLHEMPPCTGRGVIWTTGELKSALSERVSDLVFDEEGKADIAGILGALAETDFAMEGLREVLADPDSVEDWRVGEAIAEAYLTDHRACFFPWPDGRDERKSGSSLPGADLVGFHHDQGGVCLAFGEVKTSSEAQYPPGTMYGRTGLKKQLEDLRDETSIRDDLLKYLCHRAKTASWRNFFENASRRYLCDKSDVHLFGVMIRDVTPKVDDVRVRVEKLAQECPGLTKIEVLALYLPHGAVEGIGGSVTSAKSGDNL